MNNNFPEAIIKQVIVSFIFLLFMPSLSAAVETAGVSFPESMQVADTQLTLNGTGIRKATWLKVKVYVAALYLETKSTNAPAIISEASPKRLVMHFVRDVDAQKLQEGWSTGFEKNGTDLSKISDRIVLFNSSMVDMKAGQEIVLDFYNNKVDVNIAGQFVQSIEGNDFQAALLSIWLGVNPPNEELKQGLLGR